jgi:UDP-N-acetylglucosamine 2-epimerase (non-hydrolysing)
MRRRGLFWPEPLGEQKGRFDMVKTVALVVGARPNFMKAAPLMRELHKHSTRFRPLLIHTGQHYDHNMSQLFFDELKLSEPDVYLGVGSSTQARQTATIMIELENLWLESPPDLVIVFGDVNSTMAAALVAAKLRIPIAHVEAGLRSFDPNMPEEINRIVTDRLSDYLFASEESGLKHLKMEGVPDEKIFHMGNIMIDTLVNSLAVCKEKPILKELGLVPGNYAALTMHRPSNVDDAHTLADLIRVIVEESKRLPFVFPCHPRTRKEMGKLGAFEGEARGRLIMTEPVGYLEFLQLQSNAKFVLTDSGGIQEETTYLKIPCITMRKSTERPATVDVGSNVMAGPYPDRIKDAIDDVLAGRHKKGDIPKYWDGHTAERIVDLLLDRF